MCHVKAIALLFHLWRIIVNDRQVSRWESRLAWSEDEGNRLVGPFKPFRWIGNSMGAVCLCVSLTAGFSASISAAPLVDEISVLIETHNRILAAQADERAAREQIAVSEGDWNPELSVTTSYGYERQLKGNATADTSMPPRDLTMSLSQLLWDFGSTDAGIDKARLTHNQSQSTLVSTRQSLILEGISAYLEALRTQKLILFARESVGNIRHQAELEDSRVQRGSGFTTDVLQAKTELAGAEARLVAAIGAFKVAANRYRAVFGHDPGPVEDMYAPMTPFADIPETIEASIEVAMRDNPALDAAATAARIARADINITEADEFYPRLDATAETSYQEDAEGTVGEKTENLFKVELSYDFNLGFTAYNTLRASEQGHLAFEKRYEDEKDRVEEQIRNAWDNLDTARLRADHLTNQANIAGEFLELAQRERELGNRSLIDILQAETRLINANSDATSARTDVALAVYNLLSAMGHLELDVLVEN